MQKINSRIRIFLYYLISFLFLFSVYRFSFLIVYNDRLGNATTWEILHSFLVGIRFDCSVIISILSPFYLLSLLFSFNRFRIFLFIWSFLPSILFVGVGLHLLGDIVYYANANKHLGYEGFVFLNKDIFILLQSFWLDQPLITILLISVISCYIFFIAFLYNKYFTYYEKPHTFKNRILELVIFLLLAVILIRGGLQNTFLRPSHSIISNNAFINNLGLNGLFTSAFDLAQTPIPNEKKISILEASIHVKEAISYEGAEFVNPVYPILRKVTAVNEEKPPNIVIILLESWTGKFIKPISFDGLVDGKEVTPNFNRLIQKGVFFSRFFATGGRTSNGLLASLTGLPDRPMMSVLHTQEANAKVSGLGSLLKQADYESLFMTGSDLSFENIEPHIKKWGFDSIIDENEITKLDRFQKGVWGYDDADGLTLLNENLKNRKLDKPFVAVYLTISTHYPYKVPDKKFEIFDKNTNEFSFLNTFHYADFAIGEFMRAAEKEAYFENTIFVFLADHTHHRNLNHYEDRNIPFLVYSPSRFKPEIRRTIGSQLDLIPTLLGFVKKPLYFSAMGKDLFAANSKSFAYFCFGYLYGWINEDYFYFQALDATRRTVSFTMKEPYVDTGDCEISPECKLIERKTNSFLNFSIFLMEKKLVFP